MKKKVSQLFLYNKKAEIIGIDRMQYDEISEMSKRYGCKKPVSGVSHSIATIIDEEILGILRYGENENHIVCERQLDDGKYDVIVFSKKERNSDNKMLLTGGLIDVDANNEITLIQEYDLSKRVGTSVLGALFPFFKKEAEFKERFNAYAQERKKYLIKNNICNLKEDTCSLMMNDENNRNLALLSDNAYRSLIEDIYDIGVEIESTELFSNHTIFHEKFKVGSSSKFELLNNEEEAAKKEINYDKPVDWTYSEEELNLIPKIDNYVWNKEIDVLTQAINKGQKNIILFGGAGTGKSITTQKIAELYGIPWVQYSSTPETETIDLLGKYLPNTETDAANDERIEKFKEETNDYQERLDSLNAYDLAYGDFPKMYYALTGNHKKEADRLDLMKEIIDLGKKAVTFEKARDQKIEALKTKEANNFTFIESNIVKAMKYGYVLEIEEANLTNAFTGANSLFDGERGFCRLENGEMVHRHENCIVIMTMNPQYEGTRELNEAVKDRFGVKVFIDELNKEQLIERVLEKGTTLDDGLIEKMTTMIIHINEYKNINGYTEGVCGLRALLNWVRLTEALDGDYKEALNHTVMTSCSMNTEIMEDIYTNAIAPRW